MCSHGEVSSFGGTDGQYHYNDTWCFDVPTNSWTELNCIGYIPVPREGHAASLVDDVMYVFGGRGVDGKDLGDLAAFKISSESSVSICPSTHSNQTITLQISVGTCFKTWDPHRAVGPVMQCRLSATRSLYSAASRSQHRSRMTLE